MSPLLRWSLKVLHLISKNLFVSSVACLLFLHFVNIHYAYTFRPLLDSYRWTEERSVSEKTYYDRKCTDEDFSTSNMEDLIVQPRWDATKTAENILIHGASIFPGLVDRKSVHEFRNFTMEKNKNLPKEELVFVKSTYTKKKQTRWAFAFSAHDHSSVSTVLTQVYEDSRLRETLELLLGPDPAVIKMQTISSAYGAEDQEWHPDVNPKTSFISHGRNFMMHYSLFIPLQDTSASMGATGICPGTHYCGSVDKNAYYKCGQVTSGHTEDGTSMWMAGDAVLMNQNTLHRGSKHTLRGGPDRGMIVITFTSRPRISAGAMPHNPLSTPLPSVGRANARTCDLSQSATEAFRNMRLFNHSSDVVVSGQPCVSSGDSRAFVELFPADERQLSHSETRALSLGTPLTAFGHTLYDLRDSEFSMSPIMTSLRYFGLYKLPAARWGWDYVSTMFSRIATETHKYQNTDLARWLGTQKSAGFLQQLYVRHMVFPTIPATTEDRGIWDVWYTKSLDRAIHLFQKLAMALLCAYILEHSILVRDVRHGLKTRSAFPTSQRVHGIAAGSKDLGFQNHVVEPSRDDVLIATRFNGLHLHVANQFYDYHTGNRVWRDLVESSSHPFCHFSDPRDTIFKGMRGRSVQGVVSSVSGRFLLQMPFSGNFTLLSNEEALGITRRALMKTCHRGLYDLDKSVSFMIAHARFESVLRSTPISNMGIIFLQSLLTKIFGNEGEIIHASPSTPKAGRVVHSYLPESIATTKRDTPSTSVFPLFGQKIRLLKKAAQTKERLAHIQEEQISKTQKLSHLNVLKERGRRTKRRRHT
eukprot:Nitzschia sp. Nitz4//scaffold233_size31335//15774//18317//NITZ4_007951-RA/size31335-processed-gene-0.3-mRNA-1//1//CDS//3329543379//321//frame0